jgi:hypothetical protein
LKTKEETGQLATAAAGSLLILALLLLLQDADPIAGWLLINSSAVARLMVD